MKDQAASLVLKVVHTRNALETSQYPSKSKTPTLAKKWNAVLKQYIRKVPKEVKTQRLPLHTHLDIVSKNTSEYPAHITENVCVCRLSSIRVSVVFGDGGKQRLSEALKPPPVNTK